ncbi:MAG: hypothetical protein KIH64_005045 [Mycobacterium sp.]|nr:hypothetical protein [Mycobacterium sp.]
MTSEKTSEEIPLFADVMALQAAGEPGHFDANLNEHWTIGPKPHGGVRPRKRFRCLPT